jgi:acetyl-CoA decarbonylase/synthase complex subunit gamma
MADYAGAVRVRWGFGRMRYTVDPGLYALGNPVASSPVLVTANYKLTFDCLRHALPRVDAWLLVLDTKGVNVWCAAGKGTFGTAELALRIRVSGLDRVVEHRELILPQLGGPGISAHEVKKLSGFKAVYGPIRAQDVPLFLTDGRKATPEMRRKTFTLRERTVLIPVELMAALKVLVFLVPAFFLMGGLGGGGTFWNNAWTHGLFAAAALVLSLVMGAVLTPLLLPYLPGRAFSVKGLFLSIWGVLLLLIFFAGGNITWPERVAWALIIPALTAYLAMNFTGASTYTSLSGVRKEMRWAVPVEIAGGVVGLALWLVSIFIF